MRGKYYKPSQNGRDTNILRKNKCTHRSQHNAHICVAAALLLVFALSAVVVTIFSHTHSWHNFYYVRIILLLHLLDWKLQNLNSNYFTLRKKTSNDLFGRHFWFNFLVNILLYGKNFLNLTYSRTHYTNYIIDTYIFSNSFYFYFKMFSYLSTLR